MHSVKVPTLHLRELSKVVILLCILALPPVKIIKVFSTEFGKYWVSIGAVTLFAGNGVSDDTDGVGTAVAFKNINGIALDSTGNIYAGEWWGFVVRKISSNGWYLFDDIIAGYKCVVKVALQRWLGWQDQAVFKMESEQMLDSSICRVCYV